MLHLTVKNLWHKLWQAGAEQGTKPQMFETAG